MGSHIRLSFAGESHRVGAASQKWIAEGPPTDWLGDNCTARSRPAASLSRKDNKVKDGLAKNDMRVVAGPDAPEVATCPACGGIVDLRSRRSERNPDDKT